MNSLGRQVTSEFVGTAFLVATVIGSGIMATRLTEDVALQLLANSLVTGCVLIALILTLQPVSAAFNPVVTAVDAALGGTPWRNVAPLVAAQVAGGTAGAIVANLMFDLDAVSISTRDRTGSGLWLAEVVATLGLLLVIFGSIRSHRTDTIAYAVGGYITAAYWFTSSTSFANPAVTIARMFSDTFSGVAPASVPAFIGMQVVGGVLAIVLIRTVFPITTDEPSLEGANQR